MSWIVTEQPWLLEAELIATLDLPLNLSGNARNHFHPELTAIRGRAVRRARERPVLPNPSVTQSTLEE